MGRPDYPGRKFLIAIIHHLDQFQFPLNKKTWINLRYICIQLEPLDAGGESGLTFTAPHWENSPPEPVSKHTPRKPGHPAAGFYYPNLRELPAIGKVQFTKVCVSFKGVVLLSFVYSIKF